MKNLPKIRTRPKNLPRLKKLPKEVIDRINKVNQYTQDPNAVFAGLSDNNLALSAEFWIQHCQAPKNIKSKNIIYDGTFWYAIVPEMINRLKNHG